MNEADKPRTGSSKPQMDNGKPDQTRRIKFHSLGADGPAERLDAVRSLFLEYAESLDFDLCFQDFETELATLPGKYAPPQGALILATVDGEPAGCVALRPSDGDACEMKRLYVRQACRSLGLGRRLVERVIAEARARQCTAIRLDTAPEMLEAQALYASFGFRDIGAYIYNPLEGARYLELKLD